MEFALALWYGNDTGTSVIPGPRFCAPSLVHPDRPWHTARPDCWANPLDGPDRPDRIVEVTSAKYPTLDSGWGRRGTNQVPLHYAARVVWQLAVENALIGVKRCDVAAFSTVVDHWRVYRIDRDERVERAIVNVVFAWYERHVLARVPPPVDGSKDCRRVLQPRHARPRRDWERASRLDVALAKNLLRVRSEIDVLARRKAVLERCLEIRIGDAYGLRNEQGNAVATWAPRRGRSTIDAQRLRDERPDVALAFSRQGADGRVLRVIACPPEPSGAVSNALAASQKR